MSSKVMALILRDARIASLSARVGSSLLGTFADRMQHMSHRFTFTARKSALLNGEPCGTSFSLVLSCLVTSKIKIAARVAIELYETSLHSLKSDEDTFIPFFRFLLVKGILESYVLSMFFNSTFLLIVPFSSTFLPTLRKCEILLYD